MHARLIFAKTALAILAICAFNNPIQAEEAVKLRYKAKSGDKSIYHSVISFEQTQTLRLTGRSKQTRSKIVKKTIRLTSLRKLRRTVRYNSKPQTICSKSTGVLARQGNSNSTQNLMNGILPASWELR